MTAASPRLPDGFFRHAYGRLVAGLSRRFGVQHLESIEDAAQAALLAALDSWTLGRLPDDPSAWLYRVAHRRLLDELRTGARRRRLLADAAEDEPAPAAHAPEALFPDEVQDDLLRMLFICCDEAIPVEAQLALALKTLCGFSIREIALRTFSTEANVYKRLARGRARLREESIRVDALSPARLPARRAAVHQVLYMLFSEGHLSTHAETAIRRELCDEAIRLCGLLAAHPLGREPETFALLALMHLHVARTPARADAAGGLLLLEEQDRALWDQDQIRIGMLWLARSAEGDAFSRYHAEAGIAAEHCVAPSFEETRWDRVVACYELLERASPSPLHALNRAVAVAQWQGAAAGLAVVEGMSPPAWLEGSFLWSAVLADLHRRCGHDEAAARHRRAALQSAPTAAVGALLRRRLGSG